MDKQNITFKNPFKPSAGHMPPYLAGRESEIAEFDKLLEQEVIIKNMIITGLRGTGKTVLLEKLKPKAFESNWLWVGTDLSESASVSEETIAIRLLTDLSVVTSNLVIGYEKVIGIDTGDNREERKLNYENLISFFKNQPGLMSDKLKATLELVWLLTKKQFVDAKGIIFAYDEAQNMSDQSAKEQYPLSVLLDVFQSIQRKNIPFMLIFVGLPTLFPKLVETRTYSERLFKIIELDRLNDVESKQAITFPIEKEGCPVKFNEESIKIIIQESGGYPYFIQFICREVYDVFLFQKSNGMEMSVPIGEIIAKLDSDFFSGRWMKVTDRQKELLGVISQLDNCENEFSAQEILEKMKLIHPRPLSSSSTNQMLLKLINSGLIHKSRHGRYSFAVPLLGRFIRRQNIVFK